MTIPFGVGIDLLHLPRLISLLSRRSIPKFAQRILTPRELSQFNSLPPITQPFSSTRSRETLLNNPRVRFLANRWAVKEAAYKASAAAIAGGDGDGEGWMGWKSFELGSGGRGEPLLRILDGGKEVGIGKVSISHDGEHVVAVALVPERLGEV
ncbi:hypothetical protein ABW19_dt0202345 [Dactylella cylindrospora]|nr:hypothetical protein ABW19_dt0202345 [Dactylella cylindrospora]